MKTKRKVFQTEIFLVYHMSVTGLNQVSRQNWDRTFSPLQSVKRTIPRIRRPRIRGSTSSLLVTKYESTLFWVLVWEEKPDHWTVPVHSPDFSPTSFTVCVFVVYLSNLAARRRQSGLRRRCGSFRSWWQCEGAESCRFNGALAHGGTLTHGRTRFDTQSQT